MFFKGIFFVFLGPIQSEVDKLLTKIIERFPFLHLKKNLRFNKSSLDDILRAFAQKAKNKTLGEINQYCHD